MLSTTFALTLAAGPGESWAQQQDQLKAHGLIGRNTASWGRNLRGNSEDLWGDVVVASDTPCYNPPTDHWATIPAGDTALIYDRLTLDGSRRPWLHVSAFWNDANQEEKTQTIYGFGGPQVNCYIPFWAAPIVPPTPTPIPAKSPVRVIRSGNEDDATAWMRVLANAPAVADSQWSPAGVDPISAYPGAVRVPPVENSFTGDLPVTGASSWPTRQVLDPQTDRFVDVPIPAYKVYLGRGPHNFPQAELSGARGTIDYDRAAHPLNCEIASDGAYCASAADSAPFRFETFFGLTSPNESVVVAHFTRPLNSPDYWKVTWYEPSADTTYEFSAYACDEDCGPLDVVARFGGANGMSPDNRAAAAAMADFAATFVPIAP